MTLHNKILEETINYTHIDLVLAGLYFPILVDYVKEYRAASDGERESWNITYSDLVEKAQLIYSDIDEVQKANTISAGRRLGVIRQICNGNCPDMSCLIVNKASKKVGDAYQAVFNPVAERAELLKEINGQQFNFDGFTEEFQKRVEILLNSLPASPIRKKRMPGIKRTILKIKEDMALTIMHTYFNEHRAALPKSIPTQRELIVKDIMSDITVEVAFDNAVNRLESEGNKINKKT
jgi:hypothetical protein